MGKQINDMQLLSGYFYEALYYEWNTKTKNHNDPIEFRFKQADEGIQGVSSGGRKTELVQPMQGRPMTKHTFTIKTTADLPFKPKDNVKLLVEDRKYTIKSMYEGYTATNTIANLQFKKLSRNKPKILVLGEQ